MQTNQQKAGADRILEMIIPKTDSELEEAPGTKELCDLLRTVGAEEVVSIIHEYERMYTLYLNTQILSMNQMQMCENETWDIYDKFKKTGEFLDEDRENIPGLITSSIRFVHLFYHSVHATGLIKRELQTIFVMISTCKEPDEMSALVKDKYERFEKEMNDLPDYSNYDGKSLAFYHNSFLEEKEKNKDATAELHRGYMKSPEFPTINSWLLNIEKRGTELEVLLDSFSDSLSGAEPTGANPGIPDEVAKTLNSGINLSKGILGANQNRIKTSLQFATMTGLFVFMLWMTTTSTYGHINPEAVVKHQKNVIERREKRMALIGHIMKITTDATSATIGGIFEKQLTDLKRDEERLEADLASATIDARAIEEKTKELKDLQKKRDELKIAMGEAVGLASGVRDAGTGAGNLAVTAHHYINPVVSHFAVPLMGMLLSSVEKCTSVLSAMQLLDKTDKLTPEGIRTFDVWWETATKSKAHAMEVLTRNSFYTPLVNSAIIGYQGSTLNKALSVLNYNSLKDLYDNLPAKAKTAANVPKLMNDLLINSVNESTLPLLDVLYNGLSGTVNYANDVALFASLGSSIFPFAGQLFLGLELLKGGFMRTMAWQVGMWIVNTSFFSKTFLMHGLGLAPIPGIMMLICVNAMLQQAILALLQGNEMRSRRHQETMILLVGNSIVTSVFGVGFLRFMEENNRTPVPQDGIDKIMMLVRTCTEKNALKELAKLMMVFLMQFAEMVISGLVVATTIGCIMSSFVANSAINSFIEGDSNTTWIGHMGSSGGMPNMQGGHHDHTTYINDPELTMGKFLLGIIGMVNDSMQYVYYGGMIVQAVQLFVHLRGSSVHDKTFDKGTPTQKRRENFATSNLLSTAKTFYEKWQRWGDQFPKCLQGIIPKGMIRPKHNHQPQINLVISKAHQFPGVQEMRKNNETLEEAIEGMYYWTKDKKDLASLFHSMKAQAKKDKVVFGAIVKGFNNTLYNQLIRVYENPSSYKPTDREGDSRDFYQKKEKYFLIYIASLIHKEYPGECLKYITKIVEDTDIGDIGISIGNVAVYNLKIPSGKDSKPYGEFETRMIVQTTDRKKLVYAFVMCSL